MSNVLFLARSAAQLEAAEDAIRVMHEAGCTVAVVAWTEYERWLECGADEVRWLMHEVEGFEPDYFRGGFKGPRGKWAWEMVKRDRWILDRAARADIIVALENEMVFAAWNLARKHRDPAVVHGVHAALRALRARQEAETSAASTAGVATADERPSPQSRSAATKTPGRPRTARALAGRVKRKLERWVRPQPADVAPTGKALLASALPDLCRLEGAERTRRAAAVAAGLPTAKERADLWGRIAAHDLGTGTFPADLRQAAAAELEYADSLYAAGDNDAAAGSFHAAVRLMFHRAAHFDATRSPLVDDPAHFVAPLYASTVYRALARSEGRRTPAVIPPRDRPTRVLIVTDGNTNFVQDLHEHLADAHEVDVRFIAPDDLQRAPRFIRNRRRLVKTALDGAGEAAAAAEEDLRHHLDWADVVFADWCTGMAWYLTLIDPGTTRIIVRLHSYEAWTLWPHLVDFSRVDVPVFVSDHLRDLVSRTVPAVAASADRSLVVPNAMDLRRFVLPKTEDARFTLGILGFNVVAKDLLWALEVFRRLRAHNDRFRLKVIGADFEAGGTPALRRYRDEAYRQLAELEAQGALIRSGRTSDVPGALVDVGAIISSSVREGSPLAVLEGASSGAVPVVRDWPFFRALEHGPRTIYPTEWVVDTVDEAVDRLVMTTGSPELWHAAREAAASFALTNFDLDATRHLYEDLLFGS